MALYRKTLRSFEITLEKINREVSENEMDEIFYKFLVEVISEEGLGLNKKNFYYYDSSNIGSLKQDNVKFSKVIKFYIDGKKEGGFLTSGNSILKTLLRQVMPFMSINIESYKKVYGVNIRKFEDKKHCEKGYKEHIKGTMYYQGVDMEHLLKAVVKTCDYHNKRVEICLVNECNITYIKNF